MTEVKNLESEILNVEKIDSIPTITIVDNSDDNNVAEKNDIPSNQEQPLKINLLEQINGHGDIGSGNESSDVDIGEMVIPDDDLKARISKQVEFYFSDANILKDTFLLKHVRRNKEGYVSLKLIASFRKVKTMTRDSRVVAYCLSDSSELKINAENTKVRRIQELPDYDETTSSRSVLISNLAQPNPTVETISELVKEAGGDVVLIRIIRPGKQFPADLRKYLLKYPQLDNTVAAVIEYEKYEQAKNVVTILHDTSDWRKGMRAMLLTTKKESSQIKVCKKTLNKSGLHSRNNSTDSLNDLKVISKVDGKVISGPRRQRKQPVTHRRNASDYDSDDSKIPSGNWRDHMTPSSTPSSSPRASPRQSPRNSPNMRRKSTGINAKSPLTNDIMTNSRESVSSPNSPWMKRRLRADTGGSVASPSSSPCPGRKVVDEHLLRHPKGPDGGQGFGRGRAID